MIIIFLTLMLISVFIGAYALHTAMTEEEYLLDASKKQTTVIYGRYHPATSDPGLNQEMFRSGNLQTFALS